MSKEKRLYQRLAVDCPAQCSLLDSFPETFTAKIVDIGPEGVGLVVDKPLDIGTNIYLRVDLGDGEAIKFIAKIRWSSKGEDSKQYIFGAKISNTNKNDLEKFVRFYCKQSLPVKKERERKKILVVEDERGMAKLLKLELTQNGYDVVCAYDGESGFSKYMQERPDLIVLDIMLPRLNGYEVCRKIRREQGDASTPILMLTAKKEDVDRIVGGVVGAQKYLTKPFEAEHLLSEIKKLLDLKS